MMMDAEMYGMMPSANTVNRDKRAAREHVEQAQNAALLALEQLLELGGSMPGTGMCAPMR
jgi:hypothetical protein